VQYSESATKPGTNVISISTGNSSLNDIAEIRFISYKDEVKIDKVRMSNDEIGTTPD